MLNYSYNFQFLFPLVFKELRIIENQAEAFGNPKAWTKNGNFYKNKSRLDQ